MTQQTQYLTPEGETRLRAELMELTGPKREELATRLRSAIQMGDLSENADYHKAKEDQAFLEGRIQEIEAILRIATIIEKKQSDMVAVGSIKDHHPGGGFRPGNILSGRREGGGLAQRKNLKRIPLRESAHGSQGGGCCLGGDTGRQGQTQNIEDRVGIKKERDRHIVGLF